MNIGLSIFWRLHLDDEFDAWDIKTPSSDVSGNKHLELHIFEPLESDLSLILSYISMHDFNIMCDLVREQCSISISLCGSKDKNSSCSSIAIHYKSKLKVRKLMSFIKGDLNM